MLTAALRLAALVDRRLATDLEPGLSIGLGLRRHAAGRRAAAWAVLAALLMGSGLRRRPVRIALRSPNGPAVFTFPDFWAFMVAAEVLLWEEYDVAVAEPPRAVLDLGAHIGLSALFFRRRWPDARIVAVEASPSLVEVLRENVRVLGVEVRHAAVGAGPLEFVSDAPSWAGSAVTGAGDRTVRVGTVALDDLLTADVDFVKLDIEGAEFDVLPQSERLAGVATVVGEVHAPPGSAETSGALAHLAGFSVTTAAPGAGVYFTGFSAVRAAS